MKPANALDIKVLPITRAQADIVLEVTAVLGTDAANGMDRPCSRPIVARVAIDLLDMAFHVARLDRRGAIVLRQKWSRGQIEARLAKMAPCLIGVAACVGAHHLSREPTSPASKLMAVCR